MVDPDDTQRERRKGSEPAISLATLTAVNTLTIKAAILETDVGNIKNDLRDQKIESSRHREELTVKVDSIDQRQTKLETNFTTLVGILKWGVGLAGLTFATTAADLVLSIIHKWR